MINNTTRQPWRQPDTRELQARLAALPGNQGNTYEANDWTFLDTRQKSHTISFENAAIALHTYSEWLQAQNIDPVSLIKQLFLSLAEQAAITNYLKTYRGLLLTVVAMAHNNVAKLTRKTLPEVLRFRLTHSVSASNVYPKRTLSGHGALTSPHLTRLHVVCEELGLPWFGRDVSNRSITNALRKLIPELTDAELTYRDWMQGKSYNLLTLDQGQYYVEHCLNVFEEHAPLALALRQTQLETVQIARSLSIEPSSVSQFIGRILEGNGPESINTKLPNSAHRIHKAVVDHFQSAYRKTRFEHELLQEEALREIANTLGLPQSTENVDRLRVIVWDWFQQGRQEETERLLDECQVSVPWSLFEQTLESLRRRCDDKPLSLPTPEFFAALGIKRAHNGGPGPVSQFISFVTKAGVTGVVALTGWRSSEFGFPWNSIQQSSNKDKLDNYAFPHRYQVDWYVFKTNGRIRTLREITFSTVTLIDRLRHLNGSSNEQPCLYRSTADKKDPFQSEGAIESAVTAPWPHYVQHYPSFRLLDNLEAWHALAKTEASQELLTMNQHREKERLLALRPAQEWDTIIVDENLRETWRHVRAELPR
ncbi:MAG TPA: hypothetical protein ENI27_04530, partial [bacterium]|nr:hypothetical protein [bacterium]